jgi:hypothetical protein
LAATRCELVNCEGGVELAAIWCKLANCEGGVELAAILDLAGWIAADITAVTVTSAAKRFTVRSIVLSPSSGLCDVHRCMAYLRAYPGAKVGQRWEAS